MVAPAADEPLPLIAVVGGKGGVGASTLAWSLACALTEAGVRPVAVDAHPVQADLATIAGVAATDNADLLALLDETAHAEDLVTITPEGVRLLPGARGSEPRTPLDGAAADRLVAGLARLAGKADLAIVDTGPGLAPWSQRVCRRADLVLLVTTPDRLAVLDAYATAKRLHAQGQHAVQLVANRCRDAQHAAGVHRCVALACQQHLQAALALACSVMEGEATGRATPSGVAELAQGIRGWTAARATNRLALRGAA
ncbi:Flagellum site-determining protein YlxH [Pseudobythopirellula maris]|uniref:Flagellum site-determining protein YlxH n=2 Tax=Pseudobythopirellula maris TaxID=2527991 RepID=A0A5C5ZHF8_9BACT|nr:Flagellum site-determining protein YlxH [Pseudobythopirellula maris]